MPWDFVLILVVLAVLIPWRSGVRMRELLTAGDLSSLDRISLYASTIALQWAAAVLVFWRCIARGYSGHELGLTVGRPDLTIAVATALSLLLTINQVLSVRRLARLPADKRGRLADIALKIMPRSLEEVLVFVALVATVALCEEFLYRGFVQSAFERLASGSVGVGVFASAALFAAAHVYQGQRGLVAAFVLGLIFALVRHWTASLVPSIAAHFATDFSAGLLARRWFSRPTIAPPEHVAHEP